jgi:hypothetical protein
MTSLDGFQLYGFFHAGFRRLWNARQRLDRINVFPVPDGDTGTNLASTLGGALEATVAHESAAVTLGNLADALLVSARGNSGAIFAQFVAGWSHAVQAAQMDAGHLVAGVKEAALRVRAAVAEPREGTILTVIEDWAEALARSHCQTGNLRDLIGSTRAGLDRSLEGTTNQLAELKAAGVVDSGAAGFVEFVHGAHDFLVHGRDEAPPAADEAFFVTAEDVPGQPPALRYCTEALVTGPDLRADELRKVLAPWGDSLIVAPGRGRVKVHIHTDDPAGVMEVLARFGTVGNQKADDMGLQYRDAHQRTASVALVTDTACDLPPELLEKHRIHVVPLVIQAGGSEYLDKVTLPAPRLRTLAARRGAYPKTSQPPGHHFTRLYTSLASHYEQILAIHLAGALSGTARASARAAEALPGRAWAYDSRHLSGSLGLVVLRAAEAIAAGARAPEILAQLPAWSRKARILVSVRSLKSMVRGGRVSPLQGLAAQVLNLKPIVSVDAEGRSLLYGKSFSVEANLRKIVTMVAEDHAVTPLRCYAIGHSGAPEAAARMARDLEAVLGFAPLYVTEISAVVALNAGPGAVSVVTMAE